MPYNIGVAKLPCTWCSTSLWSDLPGTFSKVMEPTHMVRECYEVKPQNLRKFYSSLVCVGHWQAFQGKRKES